MTTHYVYRHYAADTTLLYIGCTSDPDKRWAAHRGGSPWASLVAEIEVCGPFPRADALAMERAAIQSEYPIHNRNHVKRRPSPMPQVMLGDLRKAAGLTLDEVCERIKDATGRGMTRGALSAIEHGHRGASVQVLSALCAAYGLRDGAITTDYSPRTREVAA